MELTEREGGPPRRRGGGGSGPREPDRRMVYDSGRSRGVQASGRGWLEFPGTRLSKRHRGSHPCADLATFGYLLRRCGEGRSRGAACPYRPLGTQEELPRRRGPPQAALEGSRRPRGFQRVPQAARQGMHQRGHEGVQPCDCDGAGRTGETGAPPEARFPAARSNGQTFPYQTVVSCASPELCNTVEQASHKWVHPCRGEGPCRAKGSFIVHSQLYTGVEADALVDVGGRGPLGQPPGLLLPSDPPPGRDPRGGNEGELPDSRTAAAPGRPMLLLPPPPAPRSRRRAGPDL